MTTARWVPTVRRLTVAIAVAALFAPGSAAGQTPGDISGVDQYVELLPGAGGKTPTGTRGDKGGSKPPPLSPKAERELRERGGSDAPLLQAIATLPEFGAPSARLSRSSGSRPRSSGARPDTSDGRGSLFPGDDNGPSGRSDSRPGNERADTSGGSGSPEVAGAAEGIPDVSFGEAISSAVGAMADTDGGGGPSPLLLALLATSAALVSAAVWRTRRNRA